MERFKSDFVYLLSCFLNRQKPQDREYDWQEIYKIADKNDVAPIVSYLMKDISPENKPSGVLMQYYKRQLVHALSRYESRESASALISEKLEHGNIDYIFVKGLKVCKYYPVPELRSSGDVDVLVRYDQIKDIQNALTCDEIVLKPYKANTLAITACDYTAELHTNADVYSDYFNDVFSLANKGDGFEYSFNEYDNLLYVICHLLKHLSYRGAGVRMLMDVDVIIRNIDSFNVDTLMSLCANANVEKSVNALLSLCKRWFDTPVEVATLDDETLLDSFSRVFIDGGSFGYEINSIPMRYIEAGGKNKSHLGVIFKIVFLPSYKLKSIYPYYNKHSILYPVAVINRIFDLAHRKQKRRAVNQLFGSENNYALMKQMLDELDIEAKM